MANERLQEEQQFHSRIYLLEILRSYAKMRLECAPQNFLMAKAMSKSYTLDCSCKCLFTLSYFTLKALFVLKILKFVSWLLSHVGK